MKILSERQILMLHAALADALHVRDLAGAAAWRRVLRPAAAAAVVFLAVVLPGNQFLPLASLAGMFYVFPIILPITNGNVVKTFIIGLIMMVIGLYFVTNLAPYFTSAAHDVFNITKDTAVAIPEGFEGGALDFASSPLAWVIFHLTHTVKYVGPAVLVVCTLGLAVLNRRAIVRKKY